MLLKLPIPWLKITALVIALLLLARTGSLLDSLELLLASAKPATSQAQVNLPTPSTDPVVIPNDPEKRVNSIDINNEGGKINRLDQDRRKIPDRVDIPKTITNRSESTTETLNSEPVNQRNEWGRDQLIENENSTFLALIEEKLNERELQIKQRIEQLQNLLARYDNANDERIMRLVSVYSSMRPKSAARIFDDLDTATLVPIAQNIIPRRLALILAEMQPEKARILSEDLSGRSLDIELIREELQQLQSEQAEIDDAKITLEQAETEPEPEPEPAPAPAQPATENESLLPAAEPVTEQ